MDFDFLMEAKKSKSRKEEDEPTNAMDHLPNEVARHIISRLPVKSLIQFRFACKSWNKLSHDPHTLQLHLLNALKGEDQCFIFHCYFPIKNLLYFVQFSQLDDDDALKEKKVNRFEIPFSYSMSEFDVVGSCNGILCLSNLLYDDAICVYNPFTRDYTKLPKPTLYQNQTVMYGFGFHPGTNQYKVIRVVNYQNSYDLNTILPARVFIGYQNMVSVAEICCLGSGNTWRSIGRMQYQLDRVYTPVLLNGRIHWITKYGVHNREHGRLIVSFDLSDEVFREVPGPEVRATRISTRNYTLSVLGGCLCVVNPLPSSQGTVDIWLMREYGRKESWVKQFHVGTYFPDFPGQCVSGFPGVWREASKLRLARVVCLLKNGEILLEYRGGYLVCYDPESGVFSSITFPGLPNPFQTILHVGSLNWIDGFPSFKLEG